MTALVFFEYLITLNDEVDLLWKRKWNAATWIFLFNRYLLIATVVSSITPYSSQASNQSRLRSAVTDLRRCKCSSGHNTHMLKSVHRTDLSCNNPRLMNTLFFLTSEDSSSLPIHGMFLNMISGICPLTYSYAQHSRFYALLRCCEIIHGDI